MSPQIPVPGRRSVAPAGVPDIYFMGNGKTGWIEVKKPGAITNPVRLAAQLEFLAVVNANGGVGLMVDCIEDLEKSGL